MGDETGALTIACRRRADLAGRDHCVQRERADAGRARRQSQLQVPEGQYKDQWREKGTLHTPGLGVEVVGGLFMAMIECDGV